MAQNAAPGPGAAGGTQPTFSFAAPSGGAKPPSFSFSALAAAAAPGGAGPGAPSGGAAGSGGGGGSGFVFDLHGAGSGGGGAAASAASAFGGRPFNFLQSAGDVGGVSLGAAGGASGSGVAAKPASAAASDAKPGAPVASTFSFGTGAPGQLSSSAGGGVAGPSAAAKPTSGGDAKPGSAAVTTPAASPFGAGSFNFGSGTGGSAGITAVAAPFSVVPGASTAPKPAFAAGNDAKPSTAAADLGKSGSVVTAPANTFSFSAASFNFGSGTGGGAGVPAAAYAPSGAGTAAKPASTVANDTKPVAAADAAADLGKSGAAVTAPAASAVPFSAGSFNFGSGTGGGAGVPAAAAAAAAAPSFVGPGASTAPKPAFVATSDAKPTTAAATGIAPTRAADLGKSGSAVTEPAASTFSFGGGLSGALTFGSNAGPGGALSLGVVTSTGSGGAAAVLPSVGPGAGAAAKPASAASSGDAPRTTVAAAAGAADSGRPLPAGTGATTASAPAPARAPAALGSDASGRLDLSLGAGRSGSTGSGRSGSGAEAASALLGPSGAPAPSPFGLVSGLTAPSGAAATAPATNVAATAAPPRPSETARQTAAAATGGRGFPGTTPQPAGRPAAAAAGPGRPAAAGPGGGDDGAEDVSGAPLFSKKLSTHRCLRSVAHDRSRDESRPSTSGGALPPCQLAVVALTTQLFALRAGQGREPSSLFCTDLTRLRLRGESHTKEVRCDPPLPPGADRLVVNRTGDMLAVMTRSSVVVVQLPKRGLEQSLMARAEAVVCATFPIGSFWYPPDAGSPVTILHCAWHPLSSYHLVLLCSGGALRMFHVTADADEPEFEHLVGDGRGDPFVYFGFAGGQGSMLRRSSAVVHRAPGLGLDEGDGSGEAEAGHPVTAPPTTCWNPFTVLLATRAGRLHALCPVVPAGCMITADALRRLGRSLSRYDHYSERGVGADEQRRAGLDWLAATFSSRLPLAQAETVNGAVRSQQALYEHRELMANDYRDSVGRAMGAVGDGKRNDGSDGGNGDDNGNDGNVPGVFVATPPRTSHFSPALQGPLRVHGGAGETKGPPETAEGQSQFVCVAPDSPFFVVCRTASVDGRSPAVEVLLGLEGPVPRFAVADGFDMVGSGEPGTRGPALVLLDRLDRGSVPLEAAAARPPAADDAARGASSPEAPRLLEDPADLSRVLWVLPGSRVLEVRLSVVRKLRAALADGYVDAPSRQRSVHEVLADGPGSGSRLRVLADGVASRLAASFVVADPLVGRFLVAVGRGGRETLVVNLAPDAEGSAELCLPDLGDAVRAADSAASSASAPSAVGGHGLPPFRDVVGSFVRGYEARPVRARFGKLALPARLESHESLAELMKQVRDPMKEVVVDIERVRVEVAERLRVLSRVEADQEEDVAALDARVRDLLEKQRVLREELASAYEVTRALARYVDAQWRWQASTSAEQLSDAERDFQADLGRKAQRVRHYRAVVDDLKDRSARLEQQGRQHLERQSRASATLRRGAPHSSPSPQPADLSRAQLARIRPVLSDHGQALEGLVRDLKRMQLAVQSYSQGLAAVPREN